MAAGTVLAIVIVVIFIAGAITGAVVLVSVASRAEDRDQLSRAAPSRFTQAGRYVTGLKVSGPDSYRGRRTPPPDAPGSQPGDPRRDHAEMSAQTNQRRDPRLR